jgi:hypothetical protein
MRIIFVVAQFAKRIFSFEKRRPPMDELIHRRTLKPEETKAFIETVEFIAKEAYKIERGIHGGGCPYPFRRRWWDFLTDWL